AHRSGNLDVRSGAFGFGPGKVLAGLFGGGLEVTGEQVEDGEPMLDLAGLCGITVLRKDGGEMGVDLACSRVGMALQKLRILSQRRDVIGRAFDGAYERGSRACRVA